jgi:S-methylmethionine-dependent homocysteine/selenocysteine methylase
MTTFRDALPQTAGDRLFLTDSGLETDLIFNHGFDLPAFASFPLVDRDPEVLRTFFADHLAVAREAGTGALFETPTWRASADWAGPLGYGPDALREVNRRAVELLAGLRDDAADDVPLVVSGNIGPRADAYRPASRMTAAEARSYHAAQIETFAGTDADLVSALTITYPAEAIGVVQAAVDADMPCVVSFTVETDGVLPDGTTVADAIRAVDDATDGAAAYFMLNCAHPDHVQPALTDDGEWTARLRGFRANASRMSHAELDDATELDDGDPVEMGAQYATLRVTHPQVTVLGGCCGTDVRHVAQIAAACAR